MFSFLVGAALLGVYDDSDGQFVYDPHVQRVREQSRSTLHPLIQDMLRESDRRDTGITVQRREAEVQQQIATDNREQERENTYVIGGAIVAGLVLLGLISRSGKKA